MRVTLITGEYPPLRGGVADYTALLARELAALGVEVSVLTSTRSAGGPPTPGVAVWPVVKDWGPAVWPAVAAHVARFAPDLLHVQYQTGAFAMRLGVNLLPWRLSAARRARPKIVVTFHDLKEPYLLPKIGRARHLATVGLAAGSDAAVATNAEDFARLADPADTRRLRRTWGGHPLAAIPIGSNIPTPAAGYDREVWRARLRAGPSDVVIAFFGFLGPDKGVDDLVTAFEALVRSGRPVRLVLVGATRGDSGRSDRPYEAAIRERLDAPALRERVAWTGFLAPADVAAHLRAADLCCLPFVGGASLRHGTLMAAIAQGLPLVTTTPSAPAAPTPFPVLRDAVDALLVPPRDPGALAAAIERLVVDDSLRRRIGQEALRLSQHFGWDAIARQTVDLYEALVGIRPA